MRPLADSQDQLLSLNYGGGHSGPRQVVSVMRLDPPGAGGENNGVIIIRINVKVPGGVDGINNELRRFGHVRIQHVR